MRVACLVMAFRAPKILGRTVPMFLAAGWDVFVHLDAKVDIGTFREAMGGSADACWFVDRRDVFWCGYSTMDAEFALIEAARCTADYDRFLFLSDDALPVAPPGALNALLAQDRDHVTAMAQPEGSFNEARYWQFFFSDHPATMLRGRDSRATALDDVFISAMTDIIALRKVGKKRITLAYGSQFWALRRDTMALVMRMVAQDAHLVASFRYAPIPDETMIQSILHTYLLRRDIDFQPMYADFHSQAGGPRLLDGVAGLPFDLHPHQVFVRKVRPDADAFAAVVCARLLEGLDAWGLPPDRGGFSALVVDEAGGALPIATMRLSAPHAAADPACWHGLETYLDRPYRWTGAERVTWSATPIDLPAGTIRFHLPMVICKPGMLEGSRLDLRGRTVALRFTRHSLIAEFAHAGLTAGTPVTLVTPPLQPGAPPGDMRMLGIGVGVV